ncbi:PAS domain-containing protein [Stieleria sp. ICT_E10.1]|uniref:chemotaxis protein CheB n=1 Tax=Stieleria sedimenti TaxID=2976331 RepID=UPI00217F5785|nr:chemotaxis protein CheB [Stieleria sedimenti]MCS7467905.1 PAS domain-containing protein [Stieleria sedimenti]
MANEKADDDDAAGPVIDDSAAVGFPVVGIGASAGGLEALDELLDNMPVDTGMAFVVVTHQHPGHTSLLPELLARETQMEVVEATDGVKLQPNHVYVGTPGGHLALLNGTLQRMDSDSPVSPKLPIDSFFRSLAQDQKERAICIVLSGTGSDGTLGLKAIKGEAGMAMVQQPQSAKYAGMPSSAEGTGMADYVLPPAAMPRHLVAYASGPYLGISRTDKSGKTEPPAIPAEPMQKIFLLLREHTGHDFSGYKANTIRRRIERRMNVQQIEHAQEYVRFLRENPNEIEVLFKELLICVTRFFRDPESWDALASGPLRGLLESRPDGYVLRAWVPGCATGEEVYTLAIVIRECMQSMKRHLGVQIFGTDLDSASVEAARLGRFPVGIRGDLSPQRLERYFTQDDGVYGIRKEIREMAVFAPQNVINDPPFTKLDLLSCRNLLIYLNAELQKRLLPIFHYALKPGGLLVLAPSETIGGFGDLFETVNKKWKIYRRKEISAAAYSLPEIPASTTSMALSNEPSDAIGTRVKESQVALLLERLAIDRFCPTFLVVNARGDLVHVHGRTGEYLEFAEGRVRTNLLDMAREGLPHELAAMLRQANATDEEVVRNNVRVKTNGHTATVTLTAMKIQQPEPIAGLVLITFRPIPTPAEDEQPSPETEHQTSDDDHTASLEREIQYIRETHQTTLEELETANEELKSTNEELQSTNEEMQSTNEELETSKEEMQSLNEELTTVNAELQSKVDDLSQANDDMQNLLNSTDIATIFLDDNLNIKRYTDQATQLIMLRRNDIGRPIGELASKLKYETLVQDCTEVLDTLVPKKRRVESTDGEWFLMRILPYRTTEKVIDGLVLTFVSIQELKEAEVIGEQRTYFESIFDTVREPLIVLDDHYTVVSANRGFYRTFRLGPNSVLKQPFFELGDAVWDLSALRGRLEEVHMKNASFDDFRIEHEFPKIGRRTFLLNARRLDENPVYAGEILLAFQDVTESDHE